ncbi:MAG: hypothetical protein ACE5HV_05695 [Acidobacteriota bacterium]
MKEDEAVPEKVVDDRLGSKRDSSRSRRVGRVGYQPLAATAFAVATIAVACARSSVDSIPPDLDYRLALTPPGVEVTLQVDGGPHPKVWVGFGLSPLGPAEVSRRIDGLSARAADGSSLPVRRAGTAAYRVDVGGTDPWFLDYRVTLHDLPADIYHRASSRSSRHLLLVGADLWARLYTSPAAIELAPAERPTGTVGSATISFARGELPEGWQIVSVTPEVEPGRYRLIDDPALSVFALGPYRQQPLGRAGMSVAIHADWTLARGRLVNTTSQLVRVLRHDLGPPPGETALLLFTPLPPEARPHRGVRTAGMAWNRTLILFGGTAPGLPQTNHTIRNMVAVFLGHELFHLYVPWGIEITRELSWLSEGWAMHMGRRAALQARLLSQGDNDAGLRDAYERYRAMGGHRAGSLEAASGGGEEIRQLLYARGELVFHIMSREWERSGKAGSFDAALWQRLALAYDGEQPLQPDQVRALLSALVSPEAVQRYVDGTATITPPELGLR